MRAYIGTSTASGRTVPGVTWRQSTPAEAKTRGSRVLQVQPPQEQPPATEVQPQEQVQVQEQEPVEDPLAEFRSLRGTPPEAQELQIANCWAQG